MSKQEQPKEAMCFRFRWFDTLLCLPEAELRSMMQAIRQYAETDQAPEFTGIMSALWNEIRDCIDFDKKQYAAKCEQARKNIAKRYKKEDTTGVSENVPDNTEQYGAVRNDTDVYGRIQTPTGDYEGLPKPTIGEGDLKKETSSKEDAKKKVFFEPPTVEKNEKVVVLKPVDFTRWQEQDFIASVYAAIGKTPEFAEFREEFCRYWLEPDKKGRFRFSLQKTWSTAGRLATWAKKAPPVFRAGRTGQSGQAHLSAAEQIRQLQEG